MNNATPFVSSLRVRGEALNLGSGTGPVLHLRAQVLEAWDAIRVDADPSASVKSLKQLALRELYPERELFMELAEDTRLIVSEPLGDVAGVWNEVPEASFGIVGRGHDELRPFRPQPPSVSVPVSAAAP